jgi:hypothetical protein
LKQVILIILFVAFIATTPNASALFGHTEAERQRRVEEEQQLGASLTQQSQATSRWQGIAFILGVGCVVTLVVGAAIGSNGRKHADDK